MRPTAFVQATTCACSVHRRGVQLGAVLSGSLNRESKPLRTPVVSCRRITY